MIKVYVRIVDEAEGHLLGEFDPVHLPQLVQAFKDNPTYAEEMTVYSFHQFVCDGGRAFFEIVVEPVSSPTKERI